MVSDLEKDHPTEATSIEKELAEVPSDEGTQKVSDSEKTESEERQLLTAED